MNKFILVEYNGVPYPEGYEAKIKEVAAHFDKTNIEEADCYSLHTEYSYGKRKLDSKLLESFPELRNSHKDNIPQLWKSKEWALEFAEFIIVLTKNKAAPTVIEVHPPFNDYCTLDEFIERYICFEKRIHEVYPETIIVLENRAGAVYKGGKFIVSKAKEIVALCEAISANKVYLGVVLDFPQLLTAEGIDTLKFNEDKYFSAIDMLCEYRGLIKGIHIWGKKKSQTGRWVAHSGNLDTYFGCNQDVKAKFIEGIMKVCSDDIPRFLVPEVNSGAEDLMMIMHDILDLIWGI